MFCNVLVLLTSTNIEFGIQQTSIVHISGIFANFFYQKFKVVRSAKKSQIGQSMLPKKVPELRPFVVYSLVNSRSSSDLLEAQCKFSNKGAGCGGKGIIGQRTFPAVHKKSFFLSGIISMKQSTQYPYNNTHRIQVPKTPFKNTEIILHSSSFDLAVLVFVDHMVSTKNA